MNQDCWLLDANKHKRPGNFNKVPGENANAAVDNSVSNTAELVLCAACTEEEDSIEQKNNGKKIWKIFWSPK